MKTLIFILPFDWFFSVSFDCFFSLFSFLSFLFLSLFSLFLFSPVSFSHSSFSHVSFIVLFLSCLFLSLSSLIPCLSPSFSFPCHCFIFGVLLEVLQFFCFVPCVSSCSLLLFLYLIFVLKFYFALYVLFCFVVDYCFFFPVLALWCCCGNICLLGVG